MKKLNHSMKKVLSAILATAVSMSLVACGSATTAAPTADTAATTETVAEASSTDTATADSGEQKKIVYWAQWAENETQATVLKGAIERFEKDHPDCTVEVNWAGRNVRDILKTSMDSGIQIDIVESGFDRLAPIGSEYYLDLTDYVKKYDLEKELLPSMSIFAKSLSPDKESWLYLPEQPFIGDMFYNKDIFTEAGITTPAADWDTFLSDCQKIKDAGYDPLTVDDAYLQVLYGQYLALEKGQDWVGELLTDKTGAMWSDPAVKQMAEAWYDFAKKGYFASSVGSNVFPAAQNGEFAVGKAAMYFNGSWVPNEVHDITGDEFNWGTMYYPQVPNATLAYETPQIGCQAFAIPKNSKYPEEAFQLCMSFLSVETQQAFADEAQCIPVVNGCTWPTNLSDVKTIMESAKDTIVWGAAPQTDADIVPIVNDAFSQLISCKITPDEFVSTLQSQIK